MERLEKIKADYNRGVMSFEDMEWMMAELQSHYSLVKLYEHRADRASNRIKELESDGRSNR